jgi:hypothetical protein
MLGSSSVAAQLAASQEGLSSLSKKVHYHVHNIPPLVSIPSLMNPAHTAPSHLSKGRKRKRKKGNKGRK